MRASDTVIDDHSQHTVHATQFKMKQELHFSQIITICQTILRAFSLRDLALRLTMLLRPMTENTADQNITNASP